MRSTRMIAAGLVLVGLLLVAIGVTTSHDLLALGGPFPLGLCAIAAAFGVLRGAATQRQRR